MSRASNVRRAWCVPVLLWAVACHRGPPEIFQIPSLTEERRGPKWHNPKEIATSKTEVFVVANPPRKSFELEALIEQFNARTLSETELVSWCGYNRLFFEETSRTSRHFQRSEDADEPSLLENRDALLAVVSWTGTISSRDTRFYSNGQSIQQILLTLPHGPWCTP
jgi:hypothetical protein